MTQVGETVRANEPTREKLIRCSLLVPILAAASWGTPVAPEPLSEDDEEDLTDEWLERVGQDTGEFEFGREKRRILFQMASVSDFSPRIRSKLRW